MYFGCLCLLLTMVMQGTSRSINNQLTTFHPIKGKFSILKSY
uniref:Uncharacterized protein n=1 Tax=Tetranychus urticae TaxID=32264 RepID=T1KYN0_TETUR